MIKLLWLKLTIIFMTILHCQCAVTLLTAVGYISIMIGLFDTAELIYSSVTKKVDMTQHRILKFNADNLENLYHYGNYLDYISKNLDNTLNMELEEYMIQNSLDAIDTVFIGSQMKPSWNIEKIDKVNSENIYKDLDNDIKKLRDNFAILLTLLSNTVLLEQQQNTFHQKKAKYQIICKTGTSYLQTLANLLKLFKTSTAIFYQLEKQNLKIREYIEGKTLVHKEIELKEYVIESYNEVLEIFKMEMKKASREIVSCDQFKPYRNNTWIEIKSFSHYIINEEDYDGVSQECYTKCRSFKKDKKVCLGDKGTLCTHTRQCLGDFVNCNSLYNSYENGFDVCLNNRNAFSRYTSLVDFETGDCPTNEKFSQWRTARYPLPLTIGHPVMGPGYLCHTCDCICVESNHYYFSREPVIADTNYVITGARLRLSKNIIHIEIEQGELFANGTVGETEWKLFDNAREVPSYNLIKINWEMRKVALTDVMLPESEVLVGLQFDIVAKGRIGLSVFGEPFDIHKGKIEYKLLRPLNNPGTEREYQQNGKAPTEAGKLPIQTSENGQFVKFTTTSLKYGGQNTIPFIDTQDVISNPAIPLSGAGLYLRGEKGYGGFIGLKLFTYDIESHIHMELFDDHKLVQ